MKLDAVILAAGAGSRLGGVAKALLVGTDRRTFLNRIIDTLDAVGVMRPIVVVGAPFASAVGAAAEGLGAAAIMNHDPARGMASSVAIGFSALAKASDADAAFLWPVDHPAVEVATLRGLIAALMHHDAARPVYNGRGGHPPLIARRVFDGLAACTNVEGGARTVLSLANTLDVVVDDPGVVRDIDTPGDLEGA